MSNRVSKRRTTTEPRQGRGYNALIISDEKGFDMASGFSALNVEDVNAQTRDEEEGVEYEPEILGRATDHVRTYLKEIGPFPLLTREGELEEERILRLRFGIGEKHEHTLEEVGQDFDLTRERIRQIEDKALSKLKHSGRADKLRSLIEN